ncbi:MAG: glycosyltransferase, partial [Coleofasciculus sp. S288]|nr:glycosyltransferase [Coleofasciculus sp. S288]
MTEPIILQTDNNPETQNSENCSDNRQIKCNKKFMLFDLSIRGHHPSYIQHLINHWYEQELSGHLDIVVSPKFIKEHSDVVDLASSYQQGSVTFTAITPEEEAILSSRKSSFNRTFRNFQEWQILCKYADLLKAKHCLVMYFDTCELPLAVGAKSPCQFSGIYFRPTFHYNELTNYTPSWNDRIQQWREKLMLSRILQHPQLQTLFCLDQFAVKHLTKFHTHVKAVHLPDPVQISNCSELQPNPNREDLGIEPGRQVFLLFGALTERKGVYQLLEAIFALPTELCQKLCLLLVGESSIKDSLETQIGRVCQAKPVQIIPRYEFISDREMQAYFQLTDVVLAPYQRHVGMSGILLLAAAAEKPVLSSDYGLMGELVRQ